MPHYPYLIVGGGMAADAAVRGIRQIDPSRAIGLLGAEPDPPYKRPPLSKGLWKGKSLDGIWLGTDRHLGGLDLCLDRRAATLDLAAKRVVDDRGAAVTFDKLLLATGGVPRRFPFGGDQVIYFRTLGDYRRLRALADRGQRFVVVGGGFIGAEIAAALAMNGKQVVLVLRRAGIGARLFPPPIAAFLERFYREKGVEVLPASTVAGVAPVGDRLAVQVRVQSEGADQARQVLADGVVAGLGITPNVGLARQAGLAVGNGIAVDAQLGTSHPDVFAAGDVAEFFQPQLGERRRVEHEDNATAMGMHAGRAMAGEAAPYAHLPFFYSDLFELGYEAVGDLDARIETVADWQEPFRRGIVYYMRAGRLRGVLLWNVWGQVEAARRLIAASGPFTAADLKGRLPA